jgi:hypothetical protein
MNRFAVSLAIVSNLVLAPAVAQTSDPKPVAPTPAPSATAVTPAPAGVVLPGGNPVITRTQTGLNKTGNDGVSTITVPAVPCSKFARETDGFTTCIGVPNPPAGENATDDVAKQRRKHSS